MSNKKENVKYQYDFDFTKEDSKLITEATGKSDQYISDINTKLESLVLSLKSKLDEVNPSKKYMDEFLSKKESEHTESLSNIVKNYIRTSSDAAKSIEFLGVSNIIKMIIELFSPEELAFICANYFKEIILDMISNSISKDLLKIPLNMELNEKERKKYQTLVEIFKDLKEKDISELFSTSAFNIIIMKSLI